METVYTGFTAMFEDGVTNIEDARPDSNKSRFITLPVYIYGVTIQNTILFIDHTRLDFVQYRVLFSFVYMDLL